MNLIAISFFLFFKLVSTSSYLEHKDPDEFINITQLIKSKGFQAENHEVHTQDGYVLGVQRIPSSKTGPKSVVFLQHGLLDSASTFAVNFKDQSLAFVLADSGYDVWLGNVRGNTYSLKHETLSPNDEKFWDFSFDEMSDYDLTSMIDYALNATNQTQLYYIGHSQGTMIQFAQLSKNPKFASKIKLFIALGPVVHVANIESSIKVLALFGNKSNQQIFYKLFGKKDFLSSSHFINNFGDKCNFEIVDKEICENVLFAFCGPSIFLNKTRVSVYLTHAPAGTSVKNLVHFAQLVISDKFQMYDYGSAEENIKYYNQSTAPIYDITKIQVPVALYWSQNDWLADPTDVEYIRKNLPNIVDDFNIENYNHLDFVWATNTKSALYDRIIKLMQKY